MGKLILRKNGLETQFINGEDFSTIVPQADTYVLGFDAVSGNLEGLDPDGNIISYGNGGSSFTGNTIDITYSGLTALMDTNGLSAGSYYLISDFRTVYDVPDFFINGDSKQNVLNSVCSIEPIIVLATSEYTIAPDAYQPDYPNDKIKYDYTWASTEINNVPTYGRISERIDEWNNRTDYDHRNAEFIRYQTYNFGDKLTGKIDSYDCTNGTVTGTDTLFLTEVNPGDILLFDTQSSFLEYQVGVKVISADTDTVMSVVVDSGYTSTYFESTLFDFYLGDSTSNNYDYKEVYVGQFNSLDYERHYTFQLNGNSLSNYIGDYCKFYLEDNYSNSGFLLPNNTFGNNSYSNTLGDRCYNNATANWFTRNTIEGRFYNNSIRSGLYSNTISQYFNNNIINGSMYNNTIGDNFNGNRTYNSFDYNVINQDFGDNTIYDYMYGNTIAQNFYNNKIYANLNNNRIDLSFQNNVVYNEFYENTIGKYSQNNIMGDKGNIFEWNFSQNFIGDYFSNNNVYEGFQDNTIGNNFQNNNIYGDNFDNNRIGTYFQYNNVRSNFRNNFIGNSFNGNQYIGNGFQHNVVGNRANGNRIGLSMEQNTIGYEFAGNKIGNFIMYGWSNLSNVTIRNYDTWRDAFDGNRDNLVGEEFVMHFYHDSGTTFTNQDLVIGETYEIANYTSGGDFSNVAQVIDGVINTTGCVFIATGTTPTFYCGTTLTELTVYDEYHAVKFTQWTQNANGGGFSYERTKIDPLTGNYSEPTVYFTKNDYGNEVDVVVMGRLEITRGDCNGIYNSVTESDPCGSGPWPGPGETDWNSIYTQNENGYRFRSNIIGNIFQMNTIGNYFGGEDGQGNVIGSWFTENLVSDYFYSNNIGTEFNLNTLGSDFYKNNIGSRFSENSIGNGFSNNAIGNDFANNTFLSNGSSNTIGNDFGGNDIGNSFQNNEIKNAFQANTIGNSFYLNKISLGFYRNTVVDYFRKNNFESAPDNTDFSSSTYVYGDYNCLIQENSANSLFLGYYDAANVFTIPTNITD